MKFRIIEQSKPLKWLCPHCEMEIEAEMLSEPDPERAYVCFFCGWRRSLAMMEYYGFVRAVTPEEAPVFDHHEHVGESGY